MREFVRSKVAIKMVSRFSLLLFLISFQWANAQMRNDCSDAPNANARRTCLHLRRMDQTARSNTNANAEREEEVWPPSLPGSPVWQQPIPVPANSRGQVATHPCKSLVIQLFLSD
jgi:hypothetical protein